MKNKSEKKPNPNKKEIQNKLANHSVRERVGICM